MSAPLNARDAKCCCECRHWHREFVGAWLPTGECRHDDKRLGLIFKRRDGSEVFKEWEVTGRYATCNLWEGK